MSVCTNLKAAEPADRRDVVPRLPKGRSRQACLVVICVHTVSYNGEPNTSFGRERNLDSSSSAFLKGDLPEQLLRSLHFEAIPTLLSPT